jgi:hypothetical protein
MGRLTEEEAATQFSVEQALAAQDGRLLLLRLMAKLKKV